MLDTPRIYFPNCFVDENRIWRKKTIIEYSKCLPVFNFLVEESEFLNQQLMWKLNNIRDFVHNCYRVEVSDLNEPIIFRSNGFLFDGWHRVTKAIIHDISSLPAVKFIVDPPPDYIIG